MIRRRQPAHDDTRPPRPPRRHQPPSPGPTEGAGSRGPARSPLPGPPGLRGATPPSGPRGPGQAERAWAAWPAPGERKSRGRRAQGGTQKAGMAEGAHWPPERRGFSRELEDLGERGGCCAGPARRRVPRVSAPTPRPRPQERVPGRRSGTAEGRLRRAARASEHTTPRLSGRQRRQPGTRRGRGTHRAGGGGGARRRGAGRVLPPQAGLQTLHGQVFAVRLPAAQRASVAREPSSAPAASPHEGGGGGAGGPGPTCHLGAPGCPPLPGRRRDSPPTANPASALEGVGPAPTSQNPGRGRDFPFKLNNTLPLPAGGKVLNFGCASDFGERRRLGRSESQAPGHWCHPALVIEPQVERKHGVQAKPAVVLAVPTPLLPTCSFPRSVPFLSCGPRKDTQQLSTSLPFAYRSPCLETARIKNSGNEQQPLRNKALALWKNNEEHILKDATVNIRSSIIT